MNRDKLHKILDLVLDLDEQGDAFMQISGHVSKISVQVCKDGWEFECEKDLEAYAYYDDAELEGVNNIIKKLEELKGESKL